MALLLALGLAGALIQPTAAAPDGAIAGQVLDAGTKAPIAGAQVTLLPARPRAFRDSPPDQLRTAISDQNGRYEFDSVAAGRYRLGAQKTGFTPLTTDDGFPDVTIAAGERRHSVNVLLQKGAAIVGRVLDEAGEPLSDVNVMVMQKRYVRPGAAAVRSAALMPAGPSAQTNDLGEFRLFGLAPGEYYLQATLQPAFDTPSAPRPRTLLPTYFPTTPDPEAAQPVAVAAGETSADAVIRMVGAAAYRVSGVVRDETGRPVANALVRLTDDDPATQAVFFGFSPQVRTDASGRFIINNVTNGTYVLLAIAPAVVGRDESRRGAGISGSVMMSGAAGGGAIMTETRDGTTLEYRDDLATRVPVAVGDADVAGLEIVVRPQPAAPR